MKEQKGNHKNADQQERTVDIYVHVIRRQPAAKSVFFSPCQSSLVNCMPMNGISLDIILEVLMMHIV